jgi:hypothetical protein
LIGQRAHLGPRCRNVSDEDQQWPAQRCVAMLSQHDLNSLPSGIFISVEQDADEQWRGLSAGNAKQRRPAQMVP